MKSFRKKGNLWIRAGIGCLALSLMAGIAGCGQLGVKFEKQEDISRKTKKEQSGLPVKLETAANLKAGEVVPADWLDFEHLEQYFQVLEISEAVYQEMNGQSYVANDHIQIKDLRYLKVLHYNYDHEIQVGELVVNQAIAEDEKNVFYELFQEEYEISSMYLIDKYWTGNGVDSDTNSIEHNNTSAFNYRVVPGTDHLSNHAEGYAIDINPIENPYVQYTADGDFAKYYQDMEKYLDRDSGKPHMITHEDAAYKVFTKYGFTWGGDWVNTKDYQHFEKRP